MSTLKVANLQNTGSGAPTVKNSSGTEVGHFAKAWVNFAGTGTVVIRDSFNCSSVTDNGTGDYTINWNASFSNNDYSCVGAGGGTTGVPVAKMALSDNDFATGSVRMEIINASAGSKMDTGIISLAAFGDS